MNETDATRILIEEHRLILFPMADQLVEGPPADALLDDFRRVESDAGGRAREFL